MKRVYLINTSNEPELTKSFNKEINTKGRKVISCKSKDLSFSYKQEDQSIQIFHEGKDITPTPEDYVFLRRWGTNKASSALLAIILDTLGVPYLDSGINRDQDIKSSKVGQQFMSPKHKLVFPTSLVCTRDNINAHIPYVEKNFTFPVVLKTLGAGRGRHVWKCTSKTDLVKKIRDARKNFDRDLYTVQEFIPNESDIRVILFEGEIIAAIERISNNGFYNNISQGGSGRIIKLTAKEKAQAKRAAKMAGLDLAGVDLVRTDEETMLFEINKAPDLLCFNEIAGFNIAGLIAEKIAKKYL